MLLDSNILIYAAEPGGEFLDPWVESAAACFASVTRIEVLGFPRWHLLDEARRTRLEILLGTLPELSLDNPVIAMAVASRREKKFSLGDAIIGATALVHGLPLITRNDGDFRHIAGIEIINPFSPTA